MKITVTRQVKLVLLLLFVTAFSGACTALVLTELPPVQYWLGEFAPRWAHPIRVVFPRVLETAASPLLPIGVIECTPIHGASISVAICDANQPSRTPIGIGGMRYRYTAQSLGFDFLVNAINTGDVVRGLSQLQARYNLPIREVAIFDHGFYGVQFLHGAPVEDSLFAAISAVTTTRPVDVLLGGCCVGGNALGRSYLQRLADSYGLRVSASAIDNIYEPSLDLSRGYWVLAEPHRKTVSRIDRPPLPRSL